MEDKPDGDRILSEKYAGRMTPVWVWFDIDGTLRSNEESYEHCDTSQIKSNTDMLDLLRVLSKCFKNVKIGAWSGGGGWYARSVCQHLDIDQYIDRYESKLNRDQLQCDIAIDDIQDCKLGDINLIVRMK